MSLYFLSVLQTNFHCSEGLHVMLRFHLGFGESEKSSVPGPSITAIWISGEKEVSCPLSKSTYTPCREDLQRLHDTYAFPLWKKERRENKRKERRVKIRREGGRERGEKRKEEIRGKETEKGGDRRGESRGGKEGDERKGRKNAFLWRFTIAILVFFFLFFIC